MVTAFVWKVRTPEGKVAVLKKYDAQTEKRGFLREVGTLARLRRHPGVVNVDAWFEDSTQGCCCLHDGIDAVVIAATSLAGLLLVLFPRSSAPSLLTDPSGRVVSSDALLPRDPPRCTVVS